MKTLYALLLSLSLSTAAFAGNGSGNVSNVQGQGQWLYGSIVQAPTSFVTIPSTATSFHLKGGDLAAALSASKFYPLYKNGVKYQVPATCNGHACVTTCYNVNFTCEGTAQRNGMQLVSSSAAISPADAAVTTTGFPTGFGAYQMGTITLSACQSSGVNGQPVTCPGGMQFGASMYVGFQAVGGNQPQAVDADCYEN